MIDFEYVENEQLIKEVLFDCNPSSLLFISSQLDLSQPLEDQGPLDVIIHKLTDLMLEADQNDSQAVLQLQGVQVLIYFMLVSVFPKFSQIQRSKKSKKVRKNIYFQQLNTQF